MMNTRCRFAVAVLCLGLSWAGSCVVADVLLRGEIRDARTGERLAARLYIRSQQGEWHWAQSAAPDGSAVEYRKQRSDTSQEMHTTLSAHPFLVHLPPGAYTLTAERGKEYLPVSKHVTVAASPAHVTLELQRWIDMASRGWYSGETHVHRSLQELPNVVLAEDLNVALPLTNWVTRANTPPSRGDKNESTVIKPEVIDVDATHVIYPLNTEYEIFSVRNQRHTLGAVFILNHKKPLNQGVPPVGPIAVEARRQGALLDLDKHSWPWSLMLVPVMHVDLFELANNHMWRTNFFFRRWTIETIADYMRIETDAGGMSERGWIDFGFQTYYALLNCGFRMMPTAGTASGVHPVPLGFSRVYVQLPEGFSYEAWMRGLAAGRSFVTTGPALFVTFNGMPPGHVFQHASDQPDGCRIRGTAESATALDRIEVIANGDVVATIQPENIETDSGGYRSAIDANLPIRGSTWFAVRCFQRTEQDRWRFAHSAPTFFIVPGQPLRPRRVEVEYLIERMQEEIARNTDILQPASLDEYRMALKIYRNLLKTAR